MFKSERESIFITISVKQSDVFTKTIRRLYENNQTSLRKQDVITGNQQWRRLARTKKVKVKRLKHIKDSGAHKEAVERHVNTKKYDNNNIVDQMNTRTQLERRNNMRVLLTIISNVRYLSRQSLALRGSWNATTGTEENSN